MDTLKREILQILKKAKHLTINKYTQIITTIRSTTFSNFLTLSTYAIVKIVYSNSLNLYLITHLCHYIK
jgi:hypothetical protein